MREIKFRAWYTKHKMMYRVFCILDNGTVRVIDDVSKIGLDRRMKEYKQKKYLDPQDFILMQFTGLYDSNGKPIYEGDVVKRLNSDEFFCVSYWELSAGFRPFTEGEFNLCFYDTEARVQYSKVVGNIYENPELLDKLSSK